MIDETTSGPKPSRTGICLVAFIAAVSLYVLSSAPVLRVWPNRSPLPAYMIPWPPPAWRVLYDPVIRLAQFPPTSGVVQRWFDLWGVGEDLDWAIFFKYRRRL